MGSSTTKCKLPDVSSFPRSLSTAKTRRGYSRKYKEQSKYGNNSLTIIGTNAAGLNTKRESLFNLMNIFKPSIVTLKETKFLFYGSLKVAGYEIFENI